MASAKKCDICGELYEHQPEEKRPINGIAICHIGSIKGYFVKKVYDTCPECTKAIMDLIAERRKDE